MFRNILRVNRYNTRVYGPLARSTRQFSTRVVNHHHPKLVKAVGLGLGFLMVPSLFTYVSNDTDAEKIEKVEEKIEEKVEEKIEESKPVEEAKIVEEGESGEESKPVEEGEAKPVEEGEKVDEDREPTAEDYEGAAYNPVTGEINWDCPCLGGMAHGPCGEEFKEAFACFVYSETEPKGIDCIKKFEGMRTCFRRYPDVYKEQLMDEEELEAAHNEKLSSTSPEAPVESAKEASS